MVHSLFPTVCRLSGSFIAQRGGNGSPKWRKQYEDGATFKRHTKRTKKRRICWTLKTKDCGRSETLKAQKRGKRKTKRREQKAKGGVMVQIRYRNREQTVQKETE